MSSVTLGDITLNYQVFDETKYMVTYLSDVTNALGAIHEIFNTLNPLYKSKMLVHSNHCGDNATTMCTMFKEHFSVSSIIFITKWKRDNEPIISVIESVYGPTCQSIGVAYHALGYVEVIIEGRTFYIAIETNIWRPVKIQFYVGTSMEELVEIIKARYQCINFFVTDDCDHWPYAASAGDKIYGGKRKDKRIKTKTTKGKRRTKRIRRIIKSRKTMTKRVK